MLLPSEFALLQMNLFLLARNPRSTAPGLEKTIGDRALSELQVEAETCMETLKSLGIGELENLRFEALVVQALLRGSPPPLLADLMHHLEETSFQAREWWKPISARLQTTARVADLLNCNWETLKNTLTNLGHRCSPHTEEPVVVFLCEMRRGNSARGYAVHGEPSFVMVPGLVDIRTSLEILVHEFVHILIEPAERSDPATGNVNDTPEAVESLVEELEQEVLNELGFCNVNSPADRRRSYQEASDLTLINPAAVQKRNSSTQGDRQDETS